jgi:hypothetical protein
MIDHFDAIRRVGGVSAITEQPNAALMSMATAHPFSPTRIEIFGGLGSLLAFFASTFLNPFLWKMFPL